MAPEVKVLSQCHRNVLKHASVGRVQEELSNGSSLVLLFLISLS